MIPQIEYDLIRQRRVEKAREVSMFRLAGRLRASEKSRSASRWSFKAIFPQANAKEVEPERA